MQNTDIIKDKLNILDVVGSYVKLEKAGKTYKGKSPFTNEKTPSFFVSPEKGFFYCFSSGKGGDMFTFVQEIERVDFRESLKILAEKAGVDLQQSNPETVSRTALQYKLLDDATKWYEVQLRKNTDAVNYLLKRGLSKDTLIKFRIGFARDSWSDIYDYLRSRKYADADIEAVGLIIKKDRGGYYDRFRSRIMFPLFDGRGRVVGFSGRIFSDNPDEKGAKYVNSPEGPLFDKSKVLYGYHTAKNEISKNNACILVEGQFDVLLAQQSGYIHTVAISGTGLSDQQMSMIHRFTDTVLLALDSDKAGIKATRRSVLAAYKHGLNVRVILMPEDMDPADVIAHSREQWDVCVADAQEYLEYRLTLANRADMDFDQKKALVDNDLFTFVALTKSAMVQDRMLQKLALFLGVSVESVRQDFKQYVPDDDVVAASTESVGVTVNQSTVTHTPQQNIQYLAIYLQDRGIEFDADTEQKQHSLYQELYTTSLQSDIDDLPEEQKNLQIFIYDQRYKDLADNQLQQVLYQSLVQEKIKKLEQRSVELLELLRQAESRNDTDAVVQHMKEQQELLKLKTDLMNTR